MRFGRVVIARCTYAWNKFTYFLHLRVIDIVNLKSTSAVEVVSTIDLTTYMVQPQII